MVLSSKSDTVLVVKKVIYTALILFIFVLGRHILIPGVDTKQILAFSSDPYLFQFVSGATGGDLSTLSLFSLGLGPWMSAAILWRILTLGKKTELKKLPTERAYIFKIVIAIIIATVQALAISTNTAVVNANIFWAQNKLTSTVIVTLIMTTGSVFLIWLSNMNDQLGIGGPVVLILAGMLIRWPAIATQYVIETFSAGIEMVDMIKIVIIILGVILLIRLSVTMQRAELRLPIKNILSDNDFSSKTYLPIQINPAGGMPLMYAMTLIVLPQYLLQLLNYWFPKNDILTLLIKNFSISEPMGITVYILILVILCVGFAFINIDPEQISEDLQQAGDYIEDVTPGKKTKEYLTQIVFNFSMIGAAYICLIAGFPLYLGIGNPDVTQVVLATGTVIILVSMVTNINDQIRALLNKHNYDSLLD
ncbi:accessory Sec system protein translocase subunit SecY2 [Leuconostoc sp. LN180020]|nr:accessory Sec system protein translocase subunit SecY2 [Leuconostoc sp. LN180020]